MLIPAKKTNKGSYWAIEYKDKNEEIKELVIRTTEEELDEIVMTVLKDETDQPIKDEDGNIKTMIYPFFLE